MFTLAAFPVLRCKFVHCDAIRVLADIFLVIVLCAKVFFSSLPSLMLTSLLPRVFIYFFFFLSNLPFLRASFRATRPAVNFGSKKQSLPVFACENVVRRGSPDALTLCASSCRLWTSDLKDPLQEDPLPFFPLRLCLSPPRCQARDILLCNTLWCGWMYFPIVCCKMPCFPTNPLCLNLLYVTPLCVPVLECLGFFRESAFYTWKK